MLLDFDDDPTQQDLHVYNRKLSQHFRTLEARAVNVPDASGLTWLHRAAQTGEWALIPSLLRMGADVHALTPAGDTALHLAARLGAKLDYRLLVQGGADPSLPNKRGETPEDLLNGTH